MNRDRLTENVASWTASVVEANRGEIAAVYSHKAAGE
jgi:hypothetical protein